MKFLHAADVHLDSPLRGLERYEGAPVEAIRGATRRAFENLVELALAERVAFVLLAGDLYDGDWRDYNTGLFFTAQMGRLAAADIPVFVVAGNHDAASQITKALRLPENVHVFSTRAPDSIVLEPLGVVVHGQGFATRSVTEDLSARFPAADPQLFNVGLLHTSLDGRVGHEPYAPCTVAGLRSKGYHYWALGHVHRREIVADDPWIVFPGNLQGRHAHETGAKGCTVVTVVDGQVAEVEQRALDVVRWVLGTVDVAGATSVDAVLDAADRTLDDLAGGAGGRLLAVRLRFTGRSGADADLRARRERVVNECRALALTIGGLWLEKVQIATTPESGGARAAAAALARDDALGGLLRSLRDIELDAARLTELTHELVDLRAKLPAEFLAPEDGLDPFASDGLRVALADVKELLLARLLAHEER